MHVRSAANSAIELPALPRWALITLAGSALVLGDLTFAATYWFFHSGVAPMRLGQGIASWVLGSHAAKAGGMTTAIAGVFLYCAVGVAMVATYLRISAHWPAMHKHPIVAGVLYGIAMYALIFEVFVPYLSAATVGGGHGPVSWTLGCLVAFAGIGLGCVAMARKHLR